jgi:hypothetical protein
MVHRLTPGDEVPVHPVELVWFGQAEVRGDLVRLVASELGKEGGAP